VTIVLRRWREINLVLPAGFGELGFHEITRELGTRGAVEGESEGELRLFGDVSVDAERPASA
jgi:hypothetical protein